MAAVRQEGRVGGDAPQARPAIGREARLLEELAAGGLDGFLTRVDHPAGDLDRHRVRAEAVLLDDDVSALGQGDDVDPVGRLEDHAVHGAAGPRVLRCPGESGRCGSPFRHGCR